MNTYTLYSDTARDTALDSIGGEMMGTQDTELLKQIFVAAGNAQFSKTITPAGTTGARTINTSSGSVNFAAAAASLVVTSSLVTTSSVIICTVGTNDATMKSVSVVASSGSFTLRGNAVPTAETRVNFLIAS